MAVSKGGFLGSVLGSIGSVSCYVRNGVNVVQTRNVNLDKIVTPVDSEIKTRYHYFLDNYKAAHNIFYQFLNFPKLLTVQADKLPLTDYVKKGLGLKKQFLEVPTVSGYVGDVKAEVVVNRASLPDEIRFNIYCDRSQFLPDEIVLVCQSVVSLKAMSVYADYLVYNGDSIRFFNVYNNENPLDVFYCDVFLYGMTSQRVSNITSFLTKLQL